jgi:hypothetical protein
MNTAQAAASQRGERRAFFVAAVAQTAGGFAEKREEKGERRAERREVRGERLS